MTSAPPEFHERSRAGKVWPARLFNTQGGHFNAVIDPCTTQPAFTAENAAMSVYDAAEIV